LRLISGHLRSHGVAYLALFIALGGTSYAAIAIPNNSVGNKQLKANAVDSKKVKNGTLLIADFKTGQLLPGAKGDKGDNGPAGLQGLQGLEGPKGDKGEAGGGSVTPLALNNGSAQQIPATPPSLIFRQTPFASTAASSIVIVEGNVQIDVTCPAGGPSCSYATGVYVDGVGMPGTSAIQTAISAGTTANDVILPTRGRLAGVGPSATHSLQVGLKQTAGNPITTVNVDGGNGYLLTVPQ
jgi:hypothetical protein